MSTDVFVPTEGEIYMKGNLSHGLGQSMDTFRKVPKASSKPPSRAGSRCGSRPGTQGTARFGALSHSSFFARHNPHPGRVRHIKGLLDVPICAVNDTMLMADPKYALQFPPSSHEDGKIKSWSRHQIPANAINVNTQIHPINTITGLQYFLGRPMNMRIFSEAINPRKGLAEVPDTWEQELRAITEAVLCAPPPAQPTAAAKPPSRQKTQYSETTGRLIPPPSRAMSRGASRQGTAANRVLNTMAGQFNLNEPEPELRVMQLLCQILQTEDINAVKQWLVAAGEREKTLVMDMIKSAMTVDDSPPEYKMPSGDGMPVQGSIGEGNGDRLTLEQCSPRPMSPLQEDIEALPTNRLPPLVNPPHEQARPMTSDAFRPVTSSGRMSARPASVLQRPQSKPVVEKPPTPPTEAKLKYTTTDTWAQDQSTV